MTLAHDVRSLPCSHTQIYRMQHIVQYSMLDGLLSVYP